MTKTLPEQRVGLARAPTSSRRSVIDLAAFLSCVAVALAAGSALVVAASPIQAPPGSWIMETIARVSAVGLPIAALFGVPVWVWLSARISSRALLIAVSPLLGIVPGVFVLMIGTIMNAEGPVFWGLFMIAAGAWSAPLASALYYLVLGKRPLVAISLGVVVVVLALLGWVNIWLNTA